jgi:hypothetical protein
MQGVLESLQGSSLAFPTRRDSPQTNWERTSRCPFIPGQKNPCPVVPLSQDNEETYVPFPLSIFTWFFKSLVWKIKFDELDFFVYFKLYFYCLYSLQKSSSKLIKNTVCQTRFFELDISKIKWRWIGCLSRLPGLSRPAGNPDLALVPAACHCQSPSKKGHLQQPYLQVYIKCF